MPIKIVVVPCLTDNYAYILHDKRSNKTTLVDAPEFKPIKKQLEKENWGLDNILLTHHHDDHIDGVSELVKQYNPKVFGAELDKQRLPNLNVTLSDREKFSASNLIFKCIEVSGHTIGHLAFHCASENIVFTGDSLMTLGCGRIFEGTASQMFESLNRLTSLPGKTIIYSGHEYAKQNAQFALSVDPNNSHLIDRVKTISKNLDSGIPNVGTSLEEEIKTNPFLRYDDKTIKKNLRMENNTSIEVFSTLRLMKDHF